MRVYTPDVIISLTEEHVKAKTLFLELDQALAVGAAIQLNLPAGIVLEGPGTAPVPYKLDVAAAAQSAADSPGKLSKRSMLLIGERVREACARFKGNKKQYATKMGISITLLTRLCHGHYDHYNNELVNIMQRLRIDVSDLPEFQTAPIAVPCQANGKPLSRKNPVVVTRQAAKTLAQRVLAALGDETKVAFARCGGVNVSTVYRLLRGDNKQLGPSITVALEKWGVEYRDLASKMPTKVRRQKTQQAMEGRLSEALPLTATLRRRIYRRIQAVQKREDWTQRQLGQKIKVGQHTISRFSPEHSKPVKFLTPSLATKLAKVVDLSGIIP
jgi:transcriptional regulator with XRE-family HTH domain